MSVVTVRLLWQSNKIISCVNIEYSDFLKIEITIIIVSNSDFITYIYLHI